MSTPDHFEMKGDEGHWIISGEIVLILKNKVVSGFLLRTGSRVRNLHFRRLAEGPFNIH